MTDLTALIERVESGAGSDRQIEIDIMVALGWSYERRGRDAKKWMYPPAGEAGRSRLNPYDAIAWKFRLTSSLDAVLSLIEAKLPGWSWENGSVGGKRGWAAMCDERQANHVGSNAPTPARALLSAALRAIQESRNADR